MPTSRVAWTGDAEADLFSLVEHYGRFDDIDIHGIVSFLNSGGFRMGNVWVKDNASPTILNASNPKTQFVHFDSDGVSFGGVEPDHTNNHLTVPNDGIYFAACFLTVNNNAAQGHTFDVSVWKNKGSTELDQIHAHRTLTGGSTDIGSIAIGSLVPLSANDVLEVWATTGVAADRSVTISDCGLLAVQLGAA